MLFNGIEKRTNRDNTGWPLLLLFFTGSTAVAQKQANIWHFGSMQCLDFSSGSPVQVTGSQMLRFHPEYIRIICMWIRKIANELREQVPLPWGVNRIIPDE